MANEPAAPGSGDKANKTDGKAAPEQPKTEVEVVQGVLDSIGQKVQSDKIKATLGDFIRLLQLRRELEEDQPRNIEVTWIDPSEKEPASEP